MESISTYQIGAIMATRTSALPKSAAPFKMVRDFIRKYAVIPTEADLDILAVWAVGTWTFSPAAPAIPFSYPYLYLTGQKGSGKTHLGNNVMSCFCRSHKPTAMMTGPVLFRMIGSYDKDSGEVISHYPCLFIDEVDALYSGTADENLRGVCNIGYKVGMTVPRVDGKMSIDFPVYCPKILGGIDNGHLPDTILDRCIRIDIKRASEDQMNSIEELYDYDVVDESAEMQQQLSNWAKDHAQVLREYRPQRTEGLSPRQWEISRSLVQIAHALGIETRIRASLAEVMNRDHSRSHGKKAVYDSIRRVFDRHETDRITTRMILAGLADDGVQVPGNSGNGLGAILRTDGIQPRMMFLPKGHPGIPPQPLRQTKSSKKQERTDGSDRQRGYFRWQFDDVFAMIEANQF